jgi:hypothetical protein
MKVLENKQGKVIIAQVAPSVRVAVGAEFNCQKKKLCLGPFITLLLGEMFDMAVGEGRPGQLAASLRMVICLPFTEEDTCNNVYRPDSTMFSTHFSLRI